MVTLPWEMSTVFYAADLIAVAVFAASGALAACRKDLDLLGIIVIASVTAVGGGTVRDLLLGRHPPFWVRDQTYLAVIGAAAAVIIAYTRWRSPPDAALAIADAIGLGVAMILGTRIAEEAGVRGAPLVLFGTITGVAGGVIRDVLTNEVPIILRPGRIYATAAVAGGVAYVGLGAAGVPQPVAAGLGCAATIGLRIAAIWWTIELPAYPLRDPGLPPGD